MLTKQYLEWINPLLYYPEKPILLYYTKATDTSIEVKDWKNVRKLFNLSHRKLRKIIWKLKFLTYLYELEVVAFNK